MILGPLLLPCHVLLFGQNLFAVIEDSTCVWIIDAGFWRFLQLGLPDLYNLLNCSNFARVSLDFHLWANFLIFQGEWFSATVTWRGLCE